MHPLLVFSDFRRLFAGRLVSAVGDRFFAIALSWWVISRGGEEAKLHLGLIMAVTFLPMVITGPFLGTLVDRLDRRLCMLWADAARFVLVGALCLLLYFDSLTLPYLYALCFLLAAFNPLFESAVSGSLADLTDADRLSQAVAVDSSVMQLSGVAGAALGSVLLAAAGVLGAFSLNAASFLLSFVFIFSIKTRLAPHPAGQSADYAGELKAGLRYAASSGALTGLLCFFAAINFFLAPISLIIPMLVKYTLREGVAWLALFELFLALGAVAAALALSCKQHYKNVYGWLFCAGVAMSACFAGLGVTENKAALCGLIFLEGAALAAGNAVAMALFQHTVAPEMKGRFFALLFTVACAVVPLTFALTGLAAGFMKLSTIIFVCGGGGLAVSLALPLLPRIRNEI